MDGYGRFKIGDKVRVLFIDGYSARNFEQMKLSVGEILTVTEVPSYSFDVKLDNGYWYGQEWLQLIQYNYSEISKRLAVL